MGRKGTFVSSHQTRFHNELEGKKINSVGRMVYAVLEVTVTLRGEILCINWEAADIMNAG